MTAALQTIERKSGPVDQPATAAIIWMHGLGADANDFVPLVPELELRGRDGSPLSIRFVFPNAPTIPVTINGGMSMRAWYDILHMDIGGGSGANPIAAPREDEKGLRASQAMVDALIAAQVATGIPASRIFLAGFSQGAAMTLMTGLRQPERLAGLIVLSGYLPLAAHLTGERHPLNHDVPIFMAHGTYDPVVRIERAMQSRDLLVKLGYAVDWHSYPMQHSVCGEEVAAIGAFLRRVLDPK
ncbi:MAG: carboxylesterase [Burkholderiaceae bacterium]